VYTYFLIALRIKNYTFQLYQMYAIRRPNEVYSILKQYNTDYIVLEDSICLMYKQDMCGLVQLLDIDNKHVTWFFGIIYLIFLIAWFPISFKFFTSSYFFQATQVFSTQTMKNGFVMRSDITNHRTQTISNLLWKIQHLEYTKLFESIFFIQTLTNTFIGYFAFCLNVSSFYDYKKNCNKETKPKK
jgi:hypothetical protein